MDHRSRRALRVLSHGLIANNDVRKLPQLTEETLLLGTGAWSIVLLDQQGLPESAPFVQGCRGQNNLIFYDWDESVIFRFAEPIIRLSRMVAIWDLGG
jgi:hypothetical protein